MDKLYTKYTNINIYLNVSATICYLSFIFGLLYRDNKYFDRINILNMINIYPVRKRIILTPEVMN